MTDEEAINYARKIVGPQKLDQLRRRVMRLAREVRMEISNRGTVFTQQEYVETLQVRMKPFWESLSSVEACALSGYLAELDQEGKGG